MNSLLHNPLWSLVLSLAAYYTGISVYKRFHKSWLNPLLIAIGLVIIVLLIFNLSYSEYMLGAGIIHAFLGPVTVVLALPLYRRRQLLKDHKYAILTGVLTGSIASLISTVLLSKVFNINAMIEKSLIPHSVTTPIGIGLSQTLGAVEGITVLSIVMTGLTGAILSPLVFKIFRITHPIARGISLGTSAHAIGTTKALEMGETAGAMSGLAIGLAAICTVIAVTIAQLAGWF